MLDDRQRRRLKVAIDDQFTVLVAVLVLVAVVGGWATYTTVADPGTHEEQHVRSSWQTVGEFNHSATVSNETPVFEEGDVLSNETFYFTDSSPVLDGGFEFKFVGAPGNATVTTESTLVNYAVHKQSGVKMWELRDPLETKRTVVQNGEPATTTFAVDVGEIRDRIIRISRVHESSTRQGDIRSAVNVSVTVDGTVAGERVNQSYNYSLPINSTVDNYVVYPPEKGDRKVRVTERKSVPNDPGAPVAVGSLLTLFAPLTALGGLFYGRENDWFAVSPATRANVKRSRLRSEFEDWISAGSVGDDTRTTVSVESLEDLVDVAIDADRRVIEDTDTGTYVVLDGDVRYQFIPEWTNTDVDDTATVDDRGSDGSESATESRTE